MNNELQELFEKAKNEKPLLSDNEVLNLLESYNSINNKKIIKGKVMNITIYTVIGAITGFMGFNILFNNDIIDEPTLQNKIETVDINKGNEKEKSIAKITPVFEKIDVAKNEKEEEKKEIKSEKNNEGFISTNIGDNKINPIIINKEQFKNLGFIINDNSVEFTALAKSLMPIRIVLAKNDYNSLDDKNPIKNGVKPVFVSDSKGNRIISLFENDSKYGFAQIIKNDESNKQVYLRKEVMINDSNDLSDIQKQLNIINGQKNISGSKTYSFDEDINWKENTKEIEYALELIDSIKTNEFETNNVEKQIIRIQSLKAQESVNAEPKPSNEPLVVKKLHIKGGEGGGLVLGSRQILINGNYDVEVDDKIIKHRGNEMVDVKDGLMIDVDVESMVDVNKLIPVALSLNNTSIDYILWFEPTLDLTEKLNTINDLKKEINELNNSETASCGGAPVENTYSDYWRSCSGVIRDLKCYPNPSSDNTNLEFSIESQRNITIEISDLAGNKIKEIITERMNEGNYLENINVSDLAAGMYYIMIRSDVGELAMQRIIVE